MDLVGLKIETALVMEQCLHHFILFEMNWHGHKFLSRCTIWGYLGSAAEYSFLLGCDIVSLGEWFPVFGRYYNALKHQELLIQPHNIMSDMTLIFLGVAMANYNENLSHLYRRGKWFIILTTSTTKGIWCTILEGSTATLHEVSDWGTTYHLFQGPRVSQNGI